LNQKKEAKQYIRQGIALWDIIISSERDARKKEGAGRTNTEEIDLVFTAGPCGKTRHTNVSEGRGR